MLTCPECKSATIEVVAMNPAQAALHCFDCEHEWTAVRDENDPDSDLELRLAHGEEVSHDSGGERRASREEQYGRYLDCGPEAWDDR